jgi:hypothetical protein
MQTYSVQLDLQRLLKKSALRGKNQVPGGSFKTDSTQKLLAFTKPVRELSSLLY